MAPSSPVAKTLVHLGLAKIRRMRLLLSNSTEMPMHEANVYYYLIAVVTSVVVAIIIIILCIMCYEPYRQGASEVSVEDESVQANLKMPPCADLYRIDAMDDKRVCKDFKKSAYDVKDGIRRTVFTLENKDKTEPAEFCPLKSPNLANTDLCSMNQRFQDTSPKLPCENCPNALAASSVAQTQNIEPKAPSVLSPSTENIMTNPSVSKEFQNNEPPSVVLVNPDDNLLSPIIIRPKPKSSFWPCQRPNNNPTSFTSTQPEIKSQPIKYRKQNKNPTSFTSTQPEIKSQPIKYRKQSGTMTSPNETQQSRGPQLYNEPHDFKGPRFYSNRPNRHPTNATESDNKINHWQNREPDSRPRPYKHQKPVEKHAYANDGQPSKSQHQDSSNPTSRSPQFYSSRRMRETPQSYNTQDPRGKKREYFAREGRNEPMNFSRIRPKYEPILGIQPPASRRYQEKFPLESRQTWPNFAATLTGEPFKDSKTFQSSTNPASPITTDFSDNRSHIWHRRDPRNHSSSLTYPQSYDNRRYSKYVRHGDTLTISNPTQTSKGPRFYCIGRPSDPRKFHKIIQPGQENLLHYNKPQDPMGQSKSNKYKLECDAAETVSPTSLDTIVKKSFFAQNRKQYSKDKVVERRYQ